MIESITFETIEKYNPIRSPLRHTTVKVFLGHKHVGTIKPVGQKWQYFPKGSKVGGELFLYLGQCKRSLMQEVANG